MGHSSLLSVMSHLLFEESGFIARLQDGRTLVDNSRFIFLIGLAVDIMLFVVLLGAFFILRSGLASLPPQDGLQLDPALALSATVCLAAASGLLGFALYAQNRNALIGMRLSLLSAMLFLAGFTMMNVTQWSMLLPVMAHTHSAFNVLYLALTGLFQLHIAASLTYVILKFRWTLHWQRYTRSGVSTAHIASFVTAMFVVWMGIYAVVYL